LLATLETVTITLPVVAPEGTVTNMLVPLQLVGVAVVPLKVIVLVPCVVPKFVPVTVTEAPTAPVVGDRLEIVGAEPRACPAQMNNRGNKRIRNNFQAFRFMCTASDVLRIGPNNRSRFQITPRPLTATNSRKKY
jgi:hypothetical protein